VNVVSNIPDVKTRHLNISCSSGIKLGFIIIGILSKKLGNRKKKEETISNQNALLSNE
jgi:hypothetical protein